MSDVEAKLAEIAQRRPRVIDLSLDRVFAALDRLGNPQQKLPPVFHVSGTNGKGSTIAFLRAMLEADNKSCHVYTSPHLVRFNERIVLGGQEVSDEVLIGALGDVDAAVGEDKLTYFETTTCAALVCFAHSPADYLLLEVGLGGRLDATNVLDKPLATLTTPVDLDHQQFLGDTLPLIAAEKAGIYKAGVPAVIGRQTPEALSVLIDRADAVGAPVFAMGRDWDAYIERGKLIYQDNDGLREFDPPALLGRHQFDNAGLAVAALRAVDLSVPDEIISAGISTARWPARMQRLVGGPLVDGVQNTLGADAQLWLDGGHNPHAALALAHILADLEARDPRPLYLITAMQANKDAAGYYSAFADQLSGAFVLDTPFNGRMAAPELRDAITGTGIIAEIVTTVDEAINKIHAMNKKEPPRILIGGSLYLAGEILRENY